MTDTLFTRPLAVGPEHCNATHMAATALLPVALDTQQALWGYLGFPEAAASDRVAGVRYILKSAALEWFTEAHEGDALEVCVSARRDRKALLLRYTLRRPEGATVVTADTAVLFLDPGTGRVVAPPPQLLAACGL